MTINTVTNSKQPKPVASPACCHLYFCTTPSHCITACSPLPGPHFTCSVAPESRFTCSSDCSTQHHVTSRQSTLTHLSEGAVLVIIQVNTPLHCERDITVERIQSKSTQYTPCTVTANKLHNQITLSSDNWNECSVNVVFSHPHVPECRTADRSQVSSLHSLSLPCTSS